MVVDDDPLDVLQRLSKHCRGGFEHDRSRVLRGGDDGDDGGYRLDPAGGNDVGSEEELVRGGTMLRDGVVVEVDGLVNVVNG
jgi:hypothetical protein